MKSPLLPSLGSLAAMAALALPSTGEAQVVVSSLSNVTVHDDFLNIDIDGNGTFDFFLNNTHGIGNGILATLSSNSVFANAAMTSSLRVFSFGSTIGLTGTSTGEFNFNLINGSTKYVGVNFERDGTQHAGWLLFDLTAPNGDIVLTAAAWQATAGVSIAAGATAIPEPAHAAAGLGFLASLAVWLRRRRASS